MVRGVSWVVVEFNLVVFLQIVLLIFIIIKILFGFCILITIIHWLLPVRNIQKCVFS